MIIERISTASFSNGLLKIQAQSMDASGNWKDSGTVEIPGSIVGDVITQLTSAANGIAEKLGNNEAENVKGSEKKASKNKKNKKVN